ncbi:hypothetical protein THAOC_10893 [Thalassiosira oceanica]|uniref:Uncharacterized protein n=1 Tax=Thalassiosira oceanica TaxID=159749 RepID=K0SNU5_THAOC|nr:hypothetical protein THAOC_10893 [Thalassiosira oceanica]|eukprot:EJK67983.1 hypothetical protein THAOC_10893 [Thalassiosira oceanica]
MLTTTTARIIFIGGLSAAMASSVQLVEDGFLPKIMAGNGGRIGDPPGLGFPGPLLRTGQLRLRPGRGHVLRHRRPVPSLQLRGILQVRPGWTRYCEASTPHSNFTCYGLAKDTSFQSFLAEADASNLECNSGVYNETGYPQYTYTVSLAKSADRHTESSFVVGFNGTQTFDRNKAIGGTMSSMFTVSPTPSPTKYLTASPVEPTPSSSSSIGKDCFFLGSTFAFVTSIIFGLI